MRRGAWSGYRSLPVALALASTLAGTESFAQPGGGPVAHDEVFAPVELQPHLRPGSREASEHESSEAHDEPADPSTEPVPDPARAPAPAPAAALDPAPAPDPEPAATPATGAPQTPESARSASRETRGAEPQERRVVVGMGSILGRDEDLPRIAGSAHVIDEAELEAREQDDVHRVLETVPGVYVRGEDGFGLRPNIGMRGASSDRSAKVTLMEDGVLAAPAPYSAPAAYYFPLMTRISSVEIFKGPASIRHGPNTIGGALNLRSRAIPAANLGYVDLAGGRFGYAKAHGYWGTTWKRFGVLLEAARVQTRGFKELDGDGDGDTGFGKNDLLAKVGYETAPGRRVGHRVELKGGFTHERSHETYLGLSSQDFADTPYRRYAASRKDEMEWWRTQVVASHVVHRDELVELETRAYRQDFDRGWRKLNGFREGPELSDLLANPEAGQSAVYFSILRGDEDSLGSEQALLVGDNRRRYASEGVETILRWRPQWRFVAQHLEAGVRLHHDWIRRIHSEDAYLMTAGTIVPEESPTVVTARNRAESLAGAFYVQDAVTLVDRFTVSPGVRLELISGQFVDDLADGSVATHRDFVAIPGVGAYVQATSWLGILAGVHAGFSPVAPGQPDEVDPERSVNYEAGARVGWDDVQAEAIGFFNDYDNLTGECTLSSGCSDEQLNRQFNAGAVRVFGVESLLRYRHRFAGGFLLGGGAQYTYTGSYFLDSFVSENPQFGEVETGDELPYVPVHQAGGNVAVGGRIWELSVSLSAVGAMRDLPGQGAIPAAERIPPHAILDLAGEVRIAGRVRLYALGNNLLANEYMISRRPFGARPGAPLSFVLGLKLHFFGA